MLKDISFFVIIRKTKRGGFMRVLSLKDYLIARRVSLIADYDIETIFNLYQPIIGNDASSLYMSLVMEAKNQRAASPITHESFLVRMQLSTQEFIKARSFLEAVGLLRTFYDNNGTYTYLLYSPKTPKSFFDNALLYGMLIKYVGEKDAMRLKSIYNEKGKEEIGDEISKSFGEVYNPDFSDPIFQRALDSNTNKGRRTAKIDSEFNYDRFFECLKEGTQIKKEALSSKEMKEIERLSTLYGVSEEASASIVGEIYDPNKEKGKRIDFIELRSRLQSETSYKFLTKKQSNGRRGVVSSDSALASKINLMEKISPKEWLGVLQNGTQPATSDLRLIDSLSSKFHLTNGVINVLIDFVLSENNNVFSRAYSEKIAGSLAREGVTTVVDAMNYLNKIKKGTKINKSSDIISKKESVTIDVVEEKEKPSEEMSWEDMMKELGGDE